MTKHDEDFLTEKGNNLLTKQPHESIISLRSTMAASSPDFQVREFCQQNFFFLINAQQLTAAVLNHNSTTVHTDD